MSLDKLKKEEGIKNSKEITTSSTINELSSLYVSDSEYKLSSWEIIQGLIRTESKRYLNESTQSLFSETASDSFEKKTFDQWILDVKTIFNIRKLGTKKLDSELLILGLNHIDSDLREFLAGKGFIESLYEEQKPAFHTLLSDEQDPKIIHADSPLYEDFLGRNGFARALCIWLDNNWVERTKLENKDKEGKSFIL